MGRTIKPRSVDANLKAEDLQIWERLCLAYQAESVVELANNMELPLGTVKNWRSRGAVPLNYCVKARKETGRSLDWIVLGTEVPSLALTSKEVNLASPLAVACAEAPYHHCGASASLPDAFGEVMVLVLEAINSRGKAPPPDKVARLVELVLEHESMRRVAKPGPATADSLRETVNRYLGLLD